MSPAVRKLALTAHVTSSVGWLGAVVGFLALAIAAITTDDVERLRGAYLTMEVVGWFVLVPLSVASLITGLVQSLGTRWGLFRHYWVVIKLLINVVATGVLLLYVQTLGEFAGVARETPLSSAALETLRDPSAILHAGAALLLLIVATTLSVYKPKGLTKYGQRKERAAQLAIRAARL